MFFKFGELVMEVLAYLSSLVIGLAAVQNRCQGSDCDGQTILGSQGQNQLLCKCSAKVCSYANLV